MKLLIALACIPLLEVVSVTFERWFEELDRIGIAQGLFDSPAAHYLCTGSCGRRPYSGDDGLFHSCFVSGMTPMQALGEMFVEQDCE